MKIYRILSVLALTLLVITSCDKALDKSAIDSKNYNAGNLAAVTFTSATLEPNRGQQVFCTATATTSGQFVEVGFIYSKSLNFTDSKTVAVKLPATTGTVTFTDTLNLSPLTQYYIKPYAIVLEGTTVCADMKTFKTYDLPFKEKIQGVYSAGELLDYWESTYEHEITIFEKNDTIWVGNLDPYFVGYGYTYKYGYNLFPATISEAEGTITIANGSAIGYGSVSLVGLNSPSVDDGTDYTDVVLKVKDNGATLTMVNAWGLYSNGWWCLYPGGYDYTKQ